MNKLLTKIVGLSLGLSMAIGVGVAVAATGVENAEPVEAAVGDTITYTITQSSVTNYPSSYSDTETTWSQNNDGGSVSMSFALAQHIKNSTNMQSKASAGYFRNTTIPDGYAIKSIQILNGSGTARTWTLYGDDDVLTKANYTSGTKVANSYTSGAAAVAYGSGTTYTTTAYPYSYFFAMRGTNAQYSSSYIVTLVELEQSTAELESVTVSGNLTKSDYTTAESWDASGLVVTANYDDESSKTVTGSSTWSFSPATPKVGGTGTYNVRFTATFDEVSGYIDKEVTVTKATEYELVTDATKLTKGTKAIFVSTATYNSTPYLKAMAGISGNATTNYFNVADVDLSDNFNAGSIAVSAGAMEFTLGGSAGNWTLTDGDTKQAAFTGTSNNNVKFNATDTDTFRITSASGNIIKVDSNSQSGRGLRYNVNSGSPRFSNYASDGQTAIYMFAAIAEASYGTTDHIEIATKPETEFAVGDTFSTAGIVINAWDSSDDSGNSKPVETFSTSISGSPSTPFDDDDIGSHTVTVTYTEDGNNFTDTYNIYVYAAATYELVEDEPANWSGNYLITFDVETATTAVTETGTYAMKSSLSNYDVVGNYTKVSPITADGKTTITAGQHLQWSFASVTGGYSIQGHSGKYIGWNSASNNGLSTLDSNSVEAAINTLSISSGDVTILCHAGTKGLTLNTTSGQFRYYSNAVVKLYKLVESSDVSDYADIFLDTLSTGSSAVCQYDSGTGAVTTDLDDLKQAWKDLADLFDSTLSNADKQQLTQGTADEKGDNVAQALALYDFIADKYNTQLQGEGYVSNYNFMGRTLVGNSSIAIFGNLLDSNNVTSMIVIISVISVSAIGGFFFLRKRKEQ